MHRLPLRLPGRPPRPFPSCPRQGSGPAARPAPSCGAGGAGAGEACSGLQAARTPVGGGPLQPLSVHAGDSLMQAGPGKVGVRVPAEVLISALARKAAFPGSGAPGSRVLRLAVMPLVFAPPNKMVLPSGHFVRHRISSGGTTTCFGVFASRLFCLEFIRLPGLGDEEFPSHVEMSLLPFFQMVSGPPPAPAFHPSAF